MPRNTLRRTARWPRKRWRIASTKRARGLLDHPHIGRPGHVEGTRERVVSRTPYLIVYRVRGQEIELLRIWHGNQDRQNQPAN